MNASQALAISQRKNNAIKNITEIIFHNITTRIKCAALMGKKAIVFDVPACVESYPVVDYGLLIRSVCKEIRKHGYTCARISEKSIYVTWEKTKKK